MLMSYSRPGLLANAICTFAPGLIAPKPFCEKTPTIFTSSAMMKDMTDFVEVARSPLVER
jgi:hypothetical protein